MGGEWVQVGSSSEQGKYAWIDETDFNYCPTGHDVPGPPCNSDVNWNGKDLCITGSGVLDNCDKTHGYCFVCRQERYPTPAPIPQPTPQPTSCESLAAPFGTIGMLNNNFQVGNSVAVSWEAGLFPHCTGYAQNPSLAALVLHICKFDNVATLNVVGCEAAHGPRTDAPDSFLQSAETASFLILRNLFMGGGYYLLRLSAGVDANVFGDSPIFQFSASPTGAPTKEPTLEPVILYDPSPVPRPAPSQPPTAEPTRRPTPTPTLRPSLLPTLTPSPAPSLAPTPLPTPPPSPLPTPEPTATFAPTPGTPFPTTPPSPLPTRPPSPSPTPRPSTLPTLLPSPPPSPSPTPLPSSPFPTPPPSPPPTIYCAAGNWFDAFPGAGPDGVGTGSRVCFPCGIGRYSFGDGTAPFPTNWSVQ